MALIKYYGREWKLVQERHFPTRSTNDLKNRSVMGLRVDLICLNPR